MRLEGVIAAEGAQERIVAAVEPLVREFVAGEVSWLDDAYRRPPRGKSGPASGYGQYCVYRRASAVSVVLFCWDAGRGTPVHDHLSWGVIGVIDGAEKETRYRRVDDGSDATRAALVETGDVLTAQGEISHVMTPERDVHKVENPGERPSLSLHVYGCDIGTRRRRRYDLATGVIEWYVTPHDSIDPAYSRD